MTHIWSHNLILFYRLQKKFIQNSKADIPTIWSVHPPFLMFQSFRETFYLPCGQHPVSLHPGTALQLFSFFCVSLFIGLRYIVVNRCDGSNYCIQIGQNINVFIFCD